MCRGYHNSESDRTTRFASAKQRRPATVLVMVVAMLMMLFVIGVTFLSTVTFESKAIDGAKKSKQQNAVVDRLSREVGTVLLENFLGKDGKPWNNEFVYDLLPADTPDGIPDTPANIGSDTYGEIPGVNPILASVEPYKGLASPPPPPGTASWFFYTASDLELAIRDIPLTKALEDNAGTIAPGLNLVHIDHELRDGQGDGDGDGTDIDDTGNPFFPEFDSDTMWRELNEGTSYFNANVEMRTGSPPPPFELYRRDADGDGVWDSYEYELPLDRYPPMLRGGLGDELRGDSTTTDSTIYYALRVIPHGAMVDIGHAHQTLLDEVLPDLDPASPNPGCVGGPYTPAGEERFLRRRFILPPRDLPLSNLQSRLTPVCDSGPIALFGSGGQIPETLYRSFVPEAEWVNFFVTPGDPNIRWWPINTGVNGGDISEILSVDSENPGWLDWMDPNNTAGIATAKYDHRHLITTVSHDDNLMRMGRTPQSGLEVPDFVQRQDWITDIANDDTNPDLYPLFIDAIVPGNFAIDEWPDAADPKSPLKGRLKVSLPGLVKELFNGNLNAHVDASESANEQRLIATIQDAFMLMLRNADINGNGTPGDTTDAQYATAAAALTADLIDFADSDDIPTRVEERDPTSGMPMVPPAYAYGLERQPFITEVYYSAAANDYLVELYNPYDASDGATPGIALNGPWGEYRIATPSDLQGHNATLNGVMGQGPNSFLVVGQDGSGIGGGTVQDAPQLMFSTGEKVQLLMVVNGDEIVVDEMVVPAEGVSRQRFTSGSGNDRWFATIGKDSDSDPVSFNDHGGTMPANTQPVEVRFANTGDITTAFPTTGSLLLLMRFANHAADNMQGAPFTTNLAAQDTSQIDNGRLPVFDTTTQLAVPPAVPPALELAIPWGQLVFDYFTALPLEHVYNMDASGDPIPNDMIPTIDQGGLRVHGRIDINAAPWRVLTGLPLTPMDTIPAVFRTKIQEAVFGVDPPNPAVPQPIGDFLAQSIVAYREARQIATGGGEVTEDFAGSRHRTGTGFLTVGELANVRAPDDASVASDPSVYNIDGGEIGNVNADYIKAVAVLVSLGDWVTTRSHVFTIYGTLRGVGQKSAVDEKAIRFQETVDRLPSFFTNRLPQRIGRRIVGAYTQADRD